MLEALANSDSNVFWILFSVLLLAAIACFYQAVKYLNYTRLIVDTPTSRIASAAQGYVELEGLGYLMDGVPVLLPGNQKPCLWYRKVIYEYESIGNQKGWKKLRDEVSDNLFLIKDASGEAVIDPDDAMVTPNHKRTHYNNNAGRKYKHVDTWISINAPLHVMGNFTTTGGAQGEFDVNADVRELLREWKADSNTMLERFDENNDGDIDLEEWKKVREAALEHVLEEHAALRKVPPTNLVDATHDRRRPFLISAKDQFDIVKRWQLYKYLYFTLFFVSGVFAVYLANLRL